MPLSIDMGLEDLKKYKPALTRKDDFKDFWKNTLDGQKKFPLNVEAVKIEYPVKGINVYDASYNGYNGQRVKAWYLEPVNTGRGGKVPAFIHFSGYTWARGYISQYVMWALQGYAVLAIDNRGQGGATPDNTVYSQGSFTGWLTRGILDKSEYYYKGAYVDCIRALDFLETRQEVNMDRIGLLGGSQGGGLALATAGLDSRPTYVMCSFPFMCNLERAFAIASDMPYLELVEYFKLFDPEMKSKDKVFETLSYFDVMNLAQSIKCPVLMAIALMDRNCPPSTSFAAYNHLQGEKECIVYPLHAHEALFSHTEHLFRFAAEHSF